MFTVTELCTAMFVVVSLLSNQLSLSQSYYQTLILALKGLRQRRRRRRQRCQREQQEQRERMGRRRQARAGGVAAAGARRREAAR